MIHIKLRDGTEIQCDTVEELSAILDRLDADDWYPDAVSAITLDRPCTDDRAVKA